MTDIDRLLTEAGAGWRAAQPPPPDLDVADLVGRFRRPQRILRPRILAPLAAAAAVALVAAGALVTFDRDPAPGAAVPDAYGGRPVIRTGDRVAVDGFVVEHGGMTFLCAPLAYYDDPGTPGRGECQGNLVLTGPGYGSRTLPWPRTEPAPSVPITTDAVTVHGRYRPGGIEVDRVEPFPGRVGWTQSRPAPTEVPCRAPAQGWTPRGGQPLGWPDADIPLRNAVGRDAGRHYTPVWEAYPGYTGQGDPRDGTTVYAVGTTGDVAAAYQELRQALPEPYNLCVYRTDTSGTELYDLMVALDRDGSTAPGRNRAGILLGNTQVTGLGDGFTGLSVAVVVVDATTVSWLRERAGDKVLPRPLVRLDP